MLEIKNLMVSYGPLKALKGIDMHIYDNQIVSLIGANGAGKTTTLMAISGMVPKDDGMILFNGCDITNYKPHAIAKLHIAHIPEGRLIFPKLTVEDNLISGTVADKGITDATKKARMEEMYSIFPRLRERRKQHGGTLSGGEQQMLAIARGMMGDPKLIMLDEPSLGLAPILVEEIFNMILRIKDSGRTVLLIEQNATCALQVSDYAYVMELGHIVLQGQGDELLNNESVKSAYLGL